ncbi:MAG: hypothetical protein V4582_18735 [Pseudomonadota bacterium]
MDALQAWIVTAAPGHPLAELARELARAGFVVEQVLGAIGCITGRADPALFGALGALPGVADIAPDSPVQLAPPDAPLS